MKKNLTNQYVITIISITLLLVMASSTAYAAIPQKINYQGYLTDPQGTTIDTTVSIVFSLYSQSSGGTALWTETQTVTVTDGVFSTDLGDTTPITLPFDTPYYLGTTIGSDSEMTPRQPLTSVGYAFRAKETDTVKDNAVTTTVLASAAVTTDKVADDAISGDKIASATITSTNIANGSVGSDQIGDGSIATEDLTDDAVTLDKLSPNVISSINGVTNDGGNVDLEAGSNITITPDDATDKITISSSGGGGGSLWTESGGNVYRDSGNVGIGTTDPQAKLSFGTDLLTPRKIALWDEVNHFYGLGLFPGQLTFLTNDTEKMSILDNGNVGIGTLFPDHKLSVTSQGNICAVLGHAENAFGVWGRSKLSTGVFGESESHDGVHGYSLTGSGVSGGSANGYSGFFYGKVKITGNLEKPAGQFKIDHPLDPENRYLSHSFVESPDMMNVYNGNVLLNEQGDAWVKLPEWFEALNRDFRYQLTCIGGFAPVYIAREISENRFKIEGGSTQMKVSWQVTGIRQDPYAQANPIQVEEEKPSEERGYYLHPEPYGQPEERGVEWLRNPEMMKKVKKARETKAQSNS